MKLLATFTIVVGLVIVGTWGYFALNTVHTGVSIVCDLRYAVTHPYTCKW